MEDVFPQLGLIIDHTLREKTATCWLEALRRGGWEVADVEVIPFTLQFPRCGISLASHTRCVTDCAISMADNFARHYREKLPIRHDLLIAGALLHDVGKCLEFERTTEGSFVVSIRGRLLRHPLSGAALASEIGLPYEVQHIIAVHSREGDGGYRSPEAWLVHFADFANFEPLRPSLSG